MFCFDHDMIEENCFVYASTLLLFFVVVVVVVVVAGVVVVVVGGTDQPKLDQLLEQRWRKISGKKATK